VRAANQEQKVIRARVGVLERRPGALAGAKPLDAWQEKGCGRELRSLAGA